MIRTLAAALTRRPWVAATLLALVVPSLVQAGTGAEDTWQRRIAAARSARATLAPAPPLQTLGGPVLTQPRVYVLPFEKVFDDLQAALDHCAAHPAVPALVLLGAGTFTGNFTLPTVGSTTIVGRDGVPATLLQGAAGVVEPVLSFAPAGGASQAEVLLLDLQLAGGEDALLDYRGTAAVAELFLHQCYLVTTGDVPAVRMIGGGQTADDDLGLDVEHCWIESQGDGIYAFLESNAEIHCEDTAVNAEGTGLLVQAALGSQDTDLHFGGGRINGATALQLGFLDDFRCTGTQLGGSGVTAELTGVGFAVIRRVDVHSESSNGFVATGTHLVLEYSRVEVRDSDPDLHALRFLGSSRGDVAFCGFSAYGLSPASNNAIWVDATSTLAAVYNHWKTMPLP